MSLTNAYTTVENLREHMGDAASAATTNELERCIDAASRDIDEKCGRRFWVDLTATTRVYRPQESGMAWVDDISSTSGLVIETDDNDDGEFETTWESTDYELQPDNADKLGASGYAWWRIVAVGNYTFPTTGKRRSLRVTALHGWSAVPRAVEEACLLRSYTLYHRRASPHGVTGLTDFGPVRTSKMDNDVMTLLSPYFRWQIGAV